MPVWTNSSSWLQRNYFVIWKTLSTIWKATSLKTVFLLSLCFCYLEQKRLCRGEPRQHWKAIVLFFSILLLHTSQSPDNLLIIPRHLDKRKRKLSLFFTSSSTEPKKLLPLLESGVRVKQSRGHLSQDSSRFTKSGDNTNSNSAALAIIGCCKIAGSLSDNCPGS